MSRFDPVEPVFGGCAWISIGPQSSRISANAAEQFFADTESVTPAYDSDADELAFIRYYDDSGILSVNSHTGGLNMGLASVLDSRQIDIDVGALDVSFRVPVRYDGESDVPYISLTDLREKTSETVSKGIPVGERA